MSAVRRSRRREEEGFVATELAAGVALLVLPLAMLVTSLPGWFERQSTARLAAREAARVITLGGECDPSAAGRAVDEVLRDEALDPSALQVTLDCAPGEPLARGGVVTARATVRMPAVAVPVLGSVAGWAWTAVHSEPVDPYASRP